MNKEEKENFNYTKYLFETMGFVAWEFSTNYLDRLISIRKAGNEKTV